jgi:hypothetical protein
MGMKNAVNVPVDVDPETGSFNPQPLVDRILEDQKKVGKAKVSAPKTWAYKLPETEEELEANLMAYEKAVDFSQFSVEEKSTWKVLLSSHDKDFLWSVWNLFAESDSHLPMLRGDTRCARELIKMLGGLNQFGWVAKKGDEWVGLRQNDKSRDAEILGWIELFMANALKMDPKEGVDISSLTRFLCARKYAYQKE